MLTGKGSSALMSNYIGRNFTKSGGGSMGMRDASSQPLAKVTIAVLESLLR